MRAINRFLWIAAIFTVSACGSEHSKYPYPPQFASPQTVHARLLDVPPAPRSAIYEADLNSVITAQKNLSDAEKQEIRAEIAVNPEMILYAVLGEHFTREAFPATYDLLIKTGSDAWRIGDSAKNYWGTTRPWLADKRVKRLIAPIYSHAYPSGHTTTGHVWAAVLSEMLPHKREEFFARANEIAIHRIAAGVHFPHDIKAGKKLAQLVVDRFHRSDAYGVALQKARAELAAKGCQLH
jgi:acid phosphatase (class A)